MSICLDCRVHRFRRCEVHAQMDTEDELLILLRRARVALLDVHQPGHPENCGTCAQLTDAIAQLLERVSGAA